MKDKGPYRVIGLWQVWERLEKGPAPDKRRPEFLLEKLCGVFDEVPDHDKWEAEIRNGDRDLAQDANVEERHQLGVSIAIGRLAWSAIQDHRTFDATGGCRHVHGSSKIDPLHVYGLRPASLRSARGKGWAPYVANYGPSFETVMKRLRDMAIEQGPEPGPIEPNVPDLAPVRIARRSRSVDAGR